MEARARERERRGESREVCGGERSSWWRRMLREGLFSCDMQRKLPPRIVAHNSTVHDRGMQNKSISRSLICLSQSAFSSVSVAAATTLATLLSSLLDELKAPANASAPLLLASFSKKSLLEAERERPMG